MGTDLELVESEKATGLLGTRSGCLGRGEVQAAARPYRSSRSGWQSRT